MLGHVDFDSPSTTNERVALLVPPEKVDRVRRNQFVRIRTKKGGVAEFLGRVVTGPFFDAPEPNGSSDESAEARNSHSLSAYAGVEIQGEVIDGRLQSTNSRPAPGSEVFELSDQELTELLGVGGDMLIGNLFGNDGVFVNMQSGSKAGLPRNLGIFGTVGSGKSNSAQVIIEEAARAGWAVIVLDVEGEYVEMDRPSVEDRLFGRLAHFDREPKGMPDLAVYYPASCASERKDAEPFTLRTADFDVNVIAEIIETTVPERNALLEEADYFRQRAKVKVTTTEAEDLAGLLDASAPGKAKLPYHLGNLIDRAKERGTNNKLEALDYLGLSTKLLRLQRSGAFEMGDMKAIDASRLLVPGRVSVFDVSVANDTIKNLVTADVLRKAFAYKILNESSPRALVVIEEAHSFISRERVATMNATLQILRDIARRGRKRWLGLSFISQQPGHLPPEIFELCNTRIVHNVKSVHNLDALMTTAGDVNQETWAMCPLLGTGQAVISSPEYKHPVLVNMRPAAAKRKFVH